MYLIRQNNFGVEIINYAARNIGFEDSDMCSERVVDSAEVRFQKQQNIDLFRNLSVDENGRDYLAQNNMRAYFKILEYGTCNSWTHFVTFTINKEHYDRYNASQDVLKRIVSYFSYFKQNIYPDFKYLLVPELHDDGAVHFHGLVYAPEKVFPLKYKTYDRRTKKAVYVSEWFLQRIGANCFIKIDNDTPYVTYYLTKYIQKELNKICCHRYYISQGLKGYRVFKNDMDVSFDLSRFLKANRLLPSFTNKYIQKFEITGITIENVLEECIELNEDQLAKYNERRLYHRMKNYIIHQEEQEAMQEKRLAEGLPLFTDQNNVPLWVTIRKKAAELVQTTPNADPIAEDIYYEFVQDDFFDCIDLDEEPPTNSQGYKALAPQ